MSTKIIFGRRHTLALAAAHPKERFHLQLDKALIKLEEAHQSRSIELRGPRIVDNLFRETPSPAMIRLARWALRKEGYGDFIPN